MNSFLHLLKGEVLRLVRYKIIFFGILVSLIWVVLIYFLDAQTAKGFMPFLAMLDAGMMSVILLGATFFLEKQEGSIKTLLVSPVSLVQVLAAKVGSAIISAMISVVMVLGSGFVFHGIQTNFLLVFLYVFVIVLSHTAIGYVITLRSKDFMSMMMKFAGLSLLLMIPSFLYLLGVIEEQLNWLLLLSPMYAAQYLIQSIHSSADLLLIVGSTLYLALLGTFLYGKVVYPRFKEFAIGG
ncbi:MAG: ABC transporter permease [Candidatus Izemoplasmatales bacterium]|nr:ABC transporter permease [bacterium]MDZ4195920.1 ABC transporter permease [Candidatus Izemoplasmatales bacterium]